ncbi:MAG: hypothetical protein JXQ96_00530 [Cyclobacteriaceae bacterium]
MKSKSHLILIACIVLCVSMSCREEKQEIIEPFIDYCAGPLTGFTLNDQIGRIYKGNPYGTFIIGNVDRNLSGGHIICNDLSENLTLPRVGSVVKFSGITLKFVQPPDQDPIDPIFGGIKLTDISFIRSY